MKGSIVFQPLAVLKNQKYETIEVETDGKNPQHQGIFQNFTNALLGKEELFVRGEEGLIGVELMDACLLSQWLGKTVELPIDDNLYLSELEKRINSSTIKKEGNDKIVNLDGTY